MLEVIPGLLEVTVLSLWCLQSWNGEGEAPPEDDASAEFLRKGNSDFRNARFKEAIMCNTEALQGSSVDNALLYSN
ncbi:hypothetical protein KC19_5G182400 [Ceratodon purpureus]|uniref:Uncharacterized protein n=1 Tax=Ceratodon purpureus TaxID=3225 RepID=A0A8T0I2W5_CERPU|nr:hypothetical protein KC19_5G182400 [Ceratodon purpureus]